MWSPQNPRRCARTLPEWQKEIANRLGLESAYHPAGDDEDFEMARATFERNGRRPSRQEEAQPPGTCAGRPALFRQAHGCQIQKASAHNSARATHGVRFKCLAVGSACATTVRRGILTCRPVCDRSS